MTRVLVIEDERKLLRGLERGLQAAGYAVTTAADGDAGHRLASTQPYDCLILDRMLPGRDGLDILADLRRAGTTTPVLLLTARDAVEDRVQGLDAGADDYLVKPFAFAELLARLRALLRRTETAPRDQPLTFADLYLDPETRETRRGDTALRLSPKELDLLAYF